MSSSRPPRWWSRLLRKQLLLVAAVGVIVLAVCAPAFADDEPPARAAVPPDTTALARASIVAGRLDDALRLLGRTIMSDRSADERATAFEMRAVVDRWVALGGTIAPRSAPAPLPGTGAGAGAATDEASAASPDAWESAFAVSRARLVAGSFQDAAPGFSLLVGSARTQHQWQRAYAMASLASELVAKDVVLRVGRSAPPAHAAAADHSPDGAPRSQHRHWYGWQTLIVDGMSILVVPVVAAKADSSAGTGLAVGGYFLGGPIVHWAHGQVGKGFGSLGLRVGLPVAGALGGMLAARAASDCISYCSVAFGLIGGAFGVAAALVIDPAVLAYERVDEEPSVARARQKPAPALSRVALSPLAAPRKEGGFDLGVGGTF